ncbi:MAG: type II toxin-antitoxin system RelE/ParE family toxin [Treponema sp.]|nr:type II toxin-antitoxin system RelE/ParE family toxin [Treponema sp.]
MRRIQKTSVFDKWINKLNDARALAIIDMRIKRLAEGNPGHCRFLGKITEMKIDFGPGYRVYYTDTDKEIVVLLCGGDKSTQQSDIETARRLAAQYCQGE